MPSSHSKSPTPKKSDSKERKQRKPGDQEGRSRSSPSSRSSRSSRSRKGSRSNEGRQRGYNNYQRRDVPKIEPNTKLFVTNIDSKFSSEELSKQLRALFGAYGNIKDIVVKTKQGSNNSYCFVDFQSLDAAIKAQEELKGKEFKGKQLKVEFGRGERKTEDRRSDKCYICHKQGHFAKQCKYNRENEGDRRDRRDDRDRDSRDYRRRDERDRDDHHRKRRYDSSSSSRSYRKRHHNDDYRRRDTRDRRSPQKRSYYSRRP